MLTRIAFIVTLLLPSLMACSELGDYLKKPTEPEAPEEVVPLPPEEARQVLADMGIQYSQKAFIESAHEGNLEAVRLFVWAGMGVDVQPYIPRVVIVSDRDNPTRLSHLRYSWFSEGQEDNDTALMRAAYGGHLEVIKFLLKNGAVRTIKNKQGENALMFAAAGGHLEVIQLLVEWWQEMCMETCVPALMERYDHISEKVAEGRCELVRGKHDNIPRCGYPGRGYGSGIYIDGPGALSRYDPLRHGPKTPMHWAAYNGHFDVVEYLHDFYLEQKFWASDFESGFYWGIIGGHMHIVRYFVDVMPNAFHNGSLSPAYGLFLASYIGNAEVAALMLDMDANIHWRMAKWIDIDTPEGAVYFKEIGFGPIHAAIQAGNRGILRSILNHWMHKFGADGRDDYGMTALHFAAAGGDKVMAKTLIDNGCPVDPKSDIGMTPLMFASEWGHADIVRMLLDLGADASAVSSYGETALSLAEEMGHADIIEMLQ